MSQPYQKKKINAFKTNAFRAGSYATFAAAIVLAIAIVLNIAVGAIPADVTQYDLSTTSMFTLTDKSRRIVRSLDEDVSVYVLSSMAEADSYIDPLLERYEALSDHISVEYVDPSIYPKFASTYTDDPMVTGSLIVVNEETGKSRAISYYEIYVEEPEYQYSSYQGQYVQTGSSWSFNGEDVITSAINYVVSDEIPVLYVLTGHGEAPLPEYVVEAIEYDNFELKDLSLLSAGAIPEDATGIIIHAPQNDLSEQEAKMIREFLLYYNGDVILVTDFIPMGEMYNLLSVCEAVGVTAMPGMVFESDANNYYQYPHVLLPNIGTHAITYPLVDAGLRVIMPYAQGILQSTAESEFTATNLLMSGTSAYSKAAGYAATTMEPEDNDYVGEFYPAVAVQNAVGKGHFVWFASAYLLDENFNNLVSGANLDLFMNALNWSCEKEESVAISSKSLDYEYLTVTSSQSTTWSIIYIGAVPVLLVLIGGIILLRRKSR